MKRVIFSPYITLKNGKRFYHPSGGVFRFEVDDEIERRTNEPNKRK